MRKEENLRGEMKARESEEERRVANEIGREWKYLLQNLFSVAMLYNWLKILQDYICI